MESIVWIVGGVAVAVLLVIEWRIMRTPEAKRSPGERRFLAADRRAGRAGQGYRKNVAPWLATGLALIVIVLAISTWSTDPAKSAVITVCAGAVAAGMPVLFFVRRRRETPEWHAQQERAQHDADVAGRPRWMSRPRAGVVVGAVFALGGVALPLAIGLGHVADDVKCGVLVLFGAFLMVAAVTQLRRDRDAR